MQQSPDNNIQLAKFLTLIQTEFFQFLSMLGIYL